MYKSICVLVLFTISAYAVTEPDYTAAMYEKCKRISGAEHASPEFHGKNMGILKSSTCFIVCLDVEKKTVHSLWNEDGSMNLRNTIDAAEKWYSHPISGRDKQHKELVIEAAKKCIHSDAVGFCNKAFDNVRCRFKQVPWSNS